MGTDAAALLSANDLKVRYNEQVVLDGATVSINETDRIGMVGRNGAGKSTFLRVITGEQVANSGQVVRRRDLIVGYLPQSFALDEERTVLENIRDGARPVLDLIRDFENLPAHSAQHEQIEHRIASLDGWNLEHRIEVAMSHLNCPQPDRQAKSLSGGEKRRVAICRAVISQPELLILDEPTNHLDPAAIEWLGGFLTEFPGALLLVTHDRWFLDQITTRMVEIANGKTYSYQGNYSRFLEAKAERQSVEELTEQKRQSFLRRELDWVRRGPPARTTKSKSRLDRFDQIASQEGPPPESDVELILPPPPPLGNRTVDLVNLAAAVGERTLFRNLTFTFEAGMKIGVTGGNGVGKTTLLKAIIGEVQPIEGTVKTGSLTKFNYVDQARLLLNDDKTVFEEIADGTEFVVFGNGRLSLRAYLKRFLFTDDRINTQVRFLSGGERSRLLLARILKNGGNFLILDEPTNDLDLQTLRVLEEGLMAFAGCVLVVSHDRFFLNRVCTGILAFEEGGNVAYSAGNYDYYLEKKRRNVPENSGRTADRPSLPLASPVSGEPKAKKLSWKEARELEGMEPLIRTIEARIQEIESLFVSPDFHRQHGPRTAEFTKELAQQKEKLNRAFERWQELEDISKKSKDC